MTLRFTSLVLFAVLFSIELQAQTGGENPQNSLLPEINPQDIEIRSEFRARFPGLRRQPILGFNPKPRVFRIDPNRMPFMESRDEAVANVAITQLDRPEPPQRATLRIPSRTNAFVKAGIGNFITPELEGYFYHGFNQDNMVSGNLDYRSSDGHLDDQLSSFRYFDGDVRYTSKLKEDISLSVDAGFLSDFNRMFNLSGAQQNLIGETARKDYTGGGGRISIRQKENELEGWEATIGGNLYAVDLDAGSTVRTGEVNEQVFEAGFSKNWAGKKLYETFHMNAYVKGGNYQFSGVNAQQWLDTRGSVEYRKMLNFSLHLSAKAGVAYISDGISNNVYLAPEAKVRYNLKDAFVITGRAYGRPEMQTVQDHQETNRFLNYQTILQHAYTSGVYGEIAFQAFEGNRIFGGMSYEITKDYAYYTRSMQPGIGGGTIGFYQTNYGKANIFEFFGGITQQLVPEKFWFDGRFYARRPKLSAGGDIPFEERIGINGSVSYKPVKEFKITGWTEYVGPRPAPSTNQELSAFLLLSGGAEYQINNRFGVYVKVLNILGQKYEIWEGYEERPLQAFGGITIKL
jgi:hypothetical protein